MYANTSLGPMLEKLLSQMPSDVRSSFSPAQLQHIDRALADSRHNVHPVDFRWTFNFWRFNYYFVFLAGRDRRFLSRRQEKLFRLSELTAVVTFLLFSTLLGVLILYLIKSALGIDIFPNFSFGIWGWFQREFL